MPKMQHLLAKMAILGSAKEARTHLAVPGLTECAEPSNPVKMAKSAGISNGVRHSGLATRAAAGFLQIWPS